MKKVEFQTLLKDKEKMEPLTSNSLVDHQSCQHQIKQYLNLSSFSSIFASALKKIHRRSCPSFHCERTTQHYESERMCSWHKDITDERKQTKKKKIKDLNSIEIMWFVRNRKVQFSSGNILFSLLSHAHRRHPDLLLSSHSHVHRGLGWKRKTEFTK